MSNIAINITENGTTTLATAGKYCDRNIDVTVDVAGSGGGGVEVEPIVLTGNCQKACSGAVASKYIELFGDTVSTEEIMDASNMFEDYQNESIPFDINIDDNASSCQLSMCFKNCKKLKELPKIQGNGHIYNLNDMFFGCNNLREMPDDYFDGLNFSKWATGGAYSYSADTLFQNCHSLRSVPLQWLKNMNPQVNYSYSYFYLCFDYCVSLDELINLPIPYTATWSGNGFYDTFRCCYRLKDITFQTNEDGTPLETQWKKQTIDLTIQTGWGSNKSWILDYNSGITADKEVTDDATYQALKDDPDWFTCNVAYSRYNHDSAVNTINSLPDTSAYLATAGGTNTIKFKGASGSLTDGGAINTLTEEEIAVATAKGWTVTLV